jgi:hypothetical protein
MRNNQKCSNSGKLADEGVRATHSVLAFDRLSITFFVKITNQKSDPFRDVRVDSQGRLPR